MPALGGHAFLAVLAGVGRPHLPRGIAVLAIGIGFEGVKGKGMGGGAMEHLLARSESRAEGRRSVEEVRRREERMSETLG